MQSKKLQEIQLERNSDLLIYCDIWPLNIKYKFIIALLHPKVIMNRYETKIDKLLHSIFENRSFRKINYGKVLTCIMWNQWDMTTKLVSVSYFLTFDESSHVQTGSPSWVYFWNLLLSYHHCEASIGMREHLCGRLTGCLRKKYGVADY